MGYMAGTNLHLFLAVKQPYISYVALSECFFAQATAGAQPMFFALSNYWLRTKHPYPSPGNYRMYRLFFRMSGNRMMNDLLHTTARHVERTYTA